MKTGYFSRVFFTLFILTSIFLLGTQISGAQPQRGCLVTLAKQAEGAGDLEFSFIAEASDGQGEIISLADGESLDGSISPGFSGTVLEQPVAGWTLADVVCEGDSGLLISHIENGISVECTEPTGDRTTCTFINVRQVSNIPTLSEWGMIAAATGLGLIGVFFAVRRRRIQTSA